MGKKIFLSEILESIRERNGQRKYNTTKQVHNPGISIQTYGSPTRQIQCCNTLKIPHPISICINKKKGIKTLLKETKKKI